MFFGLRKWQIEVIILLINAHINKIFRYIVGTKCEVVCDKDEFGNVVIPSHKYVRYTLCNMKMLDED